MKTPFIGTARRVLRPIVKPWFNRVEAVGELRALGVPEGGTLLVHSSLSSLGYVPGGAETIIRVLLDAIGAKGTLVLPTHTWRQMNTGCRTFDARNTPSCVGALTEVFRRMPRVVRSLHPTHSVGALGARAIELTRGHESAPTPCGTDTPYARILDGDGQVLLLGVGLGSNTAFHTVEALAEVSYLMQSQPERFTVIDASGNGRELLVTRHANGIARRFEAMGAFLQKHGILKLGQVGPAGSMLLDGRKFCQVLVSALRQDPTFLLAKNTDATA
ncbi:MAG: AAC(3) family N-acetyltransferase [Thermoguttaceae bacterium]